MANRLTNLQRAIAIGQLQAGKRQKDVALNLGVSQPAISLLWRKYQRTGDVKDQPRPGRPKATTEREDRFLVRTARESPFSSGNILKITIKIR